MQFLTQSLVFYNFPKIYLVTRSCFTVNVERREMLFNTALFQILYSFAERQEKRHLEERIFFTVYDDRDAQMMARK